MVITCQLNYPWNTQMITTALMSGNGQCRMTGENLLQEHQNHCAVHLVAWYGPIGPRKRAFRHAVIIARQRWVEIEWRPTSEPSARRREVIDERRGQFTSAGFLLKKTALILAKWVAIAICVFISSAVLSRTVSQNGVKIWSDESIHVSTIDQISLQRTSVAT